MTHIKGLSFGSSFIEHVRWRWMGTINMSQRNKNTKRKFWMLWFKSEKTRILFLHFSLNEKDSRQKKIEVPVQCDEIPSDILIS